MIDINNIKEEIQTALSLRGKGSLNNNEIELLFRLISVCDFLLDMLMVFDSILEKRNEIDKQVLLSNTDLLLMVINLLEKVNKGEDLRFDNKLSNVIVSLIKAKNTSIKQLNLLEKKNETPNISG